MKPFTLDVRSELDSIRTACRRSDRIFGPVALGVFVGAQLLLGTFWMSTSEGAAQGAGVAVGFLFTLLPFTLPGALLVAGLSVWIAERLARRTKRLGLESIRNRVQASTGVLLEVDDLQRAWTKRRHDLVHCYGVVDRQREEIEVALDHPTGTFRMQPLSVMVYGGEDL